MEAGKPRNAPRFFFRPRAAQVFPPGVADLHWKRTRADSFHCLRKAYAGRVHLLTGCRNMRIQSLAVEAALRSLNSTPGGLTATEAARRRLEYGPNRVERVAAAPLLHRLGREFTHFFALVLWAAAVLALSAEYFQPGEGMGRLGIAIVGVIVVNGLFSFWQEYKAERACRAATVAAAQGDGVAGWSSDATGCRPSGAGRCRLARRG